MANAFQAAVLSVLMLTLTACGGHGGGGASTPTPTPTPAAPALANFASVVVDAGPAALTTGANPTYAVNLAYVTVTVCAPGTTTCQTIDHVQLDTGSVGLRLAQGVLTPAMLAALPNQTDASANPVGECYAFVDGYVFGSVRLADFKLGGGSVADMPLQLIGDTGAFATVPTSCSSGGGANITSVQTLAANGILGIGTTPTDCGVACQSPGGFGAATYYDCPSVGCGTIIASASATTAPFGQLPNPVAAFGVDNNGTVLSLPATPSAGEASLTGTLYFGIGTETNNALGSATVLATTASDSPQGGGFVTAIFNGQTLPNSFIDSGSTQYVFADSAIAQCTSSTATGFFCPSSPVTVAPTLQAANGGTVSASFTLNNADMLFASTFSVLPGLGGDASGLGLTNDYATSFDFGLPFFFGRNIYTAIEGRTAGGRAGPFYAF